MTVTVGDLCLCDGWRVVLVIALEYDGISEDVVQVRWETLDFWCDINRLKPLSSDLLPYYPPT